MFLTAHQQPFAVIGTATEPFMAKVIFKWVGGGKMEVEHWIEVCKQIPIFVPDLILELYLLTLSSSTNLGLTLLFLAQNNYLTWSSIAIRHFFPFREGALLRYRPLIDSSYLTLPSTTYPRLTRSMKTRRTKKIVSTIIFVTCRNVSKVLKLS